MPGHRHYQRGSNRLGPAGARSDPVLVICARQHVVELAALFAAMATCSAHHRRKKLGLLQARCGLTPSVPRRWQQLERR